MINPFEDPDGVYLVLDWHAPGQPYRASSVWEGVAN
jgi:hypothetical protein